MQFLLFAKLYSNLGVFPSYQQFTIDISHNSICFNNLLDLKVLLLTLNVGPNEKFSMHSKSFVAKAKLSNRLKTAIVRHFKYNPKPVVSQQHGFRQHFCVIRSKKLSSRASVSAMKQNSYSNQCFCSRGTSEKSLSLRNYTQT